MALCGWLFGAGEIASSQEASLPPPAEIQFNRDIRPILADRCFACHGPDKNKREADLRLDTEVGLLGADGQPGVVLPAMPDQSELWRRITTDSADERMPPAEFGKELSDQDRQLIRRWIEQGARWQGHWAYTPLQRSPLPPETPGTPGQNGIDRLIRAALAGHGLQPAPPADPVTLMRRLHFDLIGLPPSPEEVDAFAADPSPQAYEQLVDRLLASPQYGERMAMWWLDLVRYADSVGYHGDQPVSVFPFRDYVIRSFQENKPFDQFTIEQLAGDLLPNPTLEQRIASGYNRLGMMSAEGGVQPKEYLAKYIAERVRNVGGTWLGVTLGCCECHDHKYDPFTMRDFYSLQAFFADIQERGLYGGAHESGDWGPSIKVPTPEQVAEREQLDRDLANVRQQLATTTPELATAQQEWEQSQASQAAVWTELIPEQIASTGGTELSRLPDGSILAAGPNPGLDTYVLTIKNPPAGITALRVDVLPHESLPKQGPGRADNGNFVLTEVVVMLQTATDAAEQPVALQHATATYEQIGLADATPDKKWSAASAIDGDAHGASFGWAIMEKVGQSHHAVFETVHDTVGGEGATLKIELRQNHENRGHTLGHFRVLATTSARPITASQLPADVVNLLAVPAEQRTDEQRAKLADYYRSIAPLLDPARQQLAQLEKQRAELEARIPTTLVTVAVEPRPIRLLSRGNWMDDSGPLMEPAVPAILPQPPAGSGRWTRLDLARWLVAPDNPLTARVLVNRLWKLCFGAGLSRKLDDVGAQGEWPSNPELLDYLAAELIDSGWNIKHVVKLIVMSDTYRQASHVTPELRELDLYNRWLARQGRWRLEAEMVRDNALRISGLLNPRVGGASVKPYQPPGYWAYLNFPTREWQNDSGELLYRRGLYTHWQRQYLHPAMLAFDAPSREECTAERARSNTPLQSLVLMNDTEFVEAARVFAQRVLREGGATAAERIAWAVRQAVSRPPQARELQVLEKLLAEHLHEYQQDAQAVDRLLSVGATPVPGDVDRAELAAWTSVTRTILNLHETITRN